MKPDLHNDPFAERSGRLLRARMQLLGCSVEFESNSRELLRLVRIAYAGVPPQRLGADTPQLRIKLWLTAGTGAHRGSEPPPLEMASGAGFLGGATAASSFVVLSPAQRAAMVAVAPELLRFPYQMRYELIEFAVFTLAARVRQLVPLHAACIGGNGNGVLLMGDSGAGKSTLSLLCLLAGFEFLSEDSVFVTPDTLLATAVSNFVHVRADSLHWVTPAREADAIRKSPVIRRRSGVRKFEVDLRQRRYKLASQPQKIRALVFLCAAAGQPPLRALSRRETLDRLAASQVYAAGQPQWKRFCASLARVASFELRRGRHPSESVEALRLLLQPKTH